ncbi:TPA: mannitol-1-phosphate 5-dehydrogenase, partial [Enterococcus faecium]|nr:mannitol-1-phosphate 5-dehydrogenase [Enterococcus faecium]
PEDEQSRQLHEMKIHENLEQLIQEVTGINDPKTIGNIKQNVNRYAKQVA